MLVTNPTERQCPGYERLPPGAEGVSVGEQPPDGSVLVLRIGTDDLNDESNTLHFNKDGYKILGERFAKKAAELIRRNP